MHIPTRSLKISRFASVAAAVWLCGTGATWAGDGGGTREPFKPFWIRFAEHSVNICAIATGPDPVCAASDGQPGNSRNCCAAECPARGHSLLSERPGFSIYARQYGNPVPPS